MRLWVADLGHYLAHALRAVGLALAAVAWASALASEAQQYNDLRSYALVASAVVTLIVSHWFSGPPPSARLVEVLRVYERDLVAVAREQRVHVSELAVLAIERLQHSANVPSDRRAWLRLLAQSARDRRATVEAR